MGAVSFTRKLGARSGVQLNPKRDNTDYPNLSVSDQVASIAGRFDRGRIDKSFRVNTNTQTRMLGQPGSINASALNEPRIQIYEMLRDGCAEVVVSRLITSAAVNKAVVCKNALAAAPDTVWTVATGSDTGFLFTLKHLECFSDGVIFEIHAPLVEDDSDVAIATKWIRLRLIDPVTKAELFPEVEGSLDPTAKDESGNSVFIQDVITQYTDTVELTVAAGASVLPTSVFYGLDADGVAKYSSKLLSYFTEGGTTYVNGDYDAACLRLRRSQVGFGFIGSGGTRNTALISRLLGLGFQVNKQVRWDIYGGLDPAAAINFAKSVGGTNSEYSQCFWAPLYADDPVNGGKSYIGTSGINIGLACARNAVVNSDGIARKNYPIAGSEFPLTRSGVIQKYDPSEPELDALAEAKINPVLFVDYATGGRYAFVDSLTGALTNGDKSLIAVADMASTVDDVFTQYAQECLQKPMLIAVKMMTEFVQIYLENIETAQWIKPSVELGNRSFLATIKPSDAAPNKLMVLDYWAHYDGTNRATHVTQTLSK